MIQSCTTWFDAHRARAALNLPAEAVGGGILAFCFTLFFVFLFVPRELHAEGFVPTGFGGSLGYGYGYSRVGENESENTSTVVSGVMTGFIWEPWFMTSDFGLSLGLSESESSSSTAVIARTVGGNGDFTLFPLSRFPTSFGFSFADSRQELAESPNVKGAAFQMRRFYLRQTYLSPQGWTVGGYYNQSSVLVVDTDAESIERSFGLEARHRFSHHDFEFDFTYFVNEPSDSSVEFRSSNSILAHSYFPSTEVGVSSVATYSTSDVAGSSTDPQFSYTQASSSFYWRPEHRPYFFSGAVRLFQSDSGESTRGVSTNANASYRLSRNISFTAAVTVSVSDYSGKQSTDSTQSLSALYFSDTFSIVGFEYGWFTGASVSNSISRSDESQVGESSDSAKDVQSANATISHRLSRNWAFGKSANANMGVAQSASKSTNSTSEDSPTNLSNSVSTGFSHFGFGGSSNVNFTVSDARTIGETETEFQVASLQIGRSQEISRLSSMSVSASAQASRSKSLIGSTSPEPRESTTRSATASASYAHSRLLGIRNLLYNSQLNFPNLIKQETQSVQTTAEWINSFNYSLGLLSSSLVIRAMESAGSRAYNASFQLLRTF